MSIANIELEIDEATKENSSGKFMQYTGEELA